MISESASDMDSNSRSYSDFPIRYDISILLFRVWTFTPCSAFQVTTIEYASILRYIFGESTPTKFKDSAAPWTHCLR